ncbi:MAG: MBL fold metallo-hydrolase [Lachnospiraceae bacterium]|jgi:hydroxyacylglutathione hydrolase
MADADEIRIDGRIVGPIGTNCYLVANEATKEGIVIDPGFEPERIEAMVKKDGVRVTAVLITHGHFDHISKARETADALGAPVWAPETDKALFTDCQSNLSALMGYGSVTLKPDRYLRPDEELQTAGLSIRCLLTPGHTPGGMSYYIPAAKALFSGDTLFYESVGRTDFPGGSMSAIVRSIRDVLMALPDDTEVYPGHGGLTSIGHERENNPYI